MPHSIFNIFLDLYIQQEEEMELKQRMRKMDLSSDTLDLPVFQRGHESVTNSGPEVS